MWKEIEGYEGYYEVSDDGQVRSLDRYVADIKGKQTGKRRFLRGAVMKQSVSTGRDHNSYYVVNLHRDHTSKVMLVHMLVARAFIPNPNNLPTVNHIDGNKHNNCVSNLEWASFSDNNTHALETGLRNPRGNAVAQYSLSGKLVRKFRSASEASRVTGISRGMISHCLNGRNKTASGFVWKKLSESQTTIPQGSTQDDELPAEAQRPLE